ncbi:phage holin [Lysinibacillus sp. NPDC093712]|uniref:phage holin n=1 Tax=Lysinibacillus sp. NPDC093712 TaxID=3390579 RepID=UPI003CFDB743
MKINWKVRLKNPQFWIAIVVVFFANLFAMSGVTFEEINSWDQLGVLLLSALKNPYTFITLGAFVYATVIDFTTPKIGDSPLVLDKKTIKK